MLEHLTIVSHPLVQHKLTLMREKDTSTASFRQLLREISNLFTVQPNPINSLTVEGHLAGLKISTVRQYISRRTDFSPSYMERFFGRK